MKIDFDEKLHAYKIDGKPVPSVSRILDVESQDFRCSQEDLEYSASLGRAVHKACELWDKGILKVSSLDPVVIPRLEAWKKFVADYEPVWLHIEALIGSKIHGFAGTCDRGGIIQGKATLGDIKTGVISRRTGKQLGGYAIGYKERFSLIPTRLYAIQLNADGGYKVSEYEVRVARDEFMVLLKKYKGEKHGE